MRLMQAYHRMVSAAALVGLMLSAIAQTEVSLRNRVDASRTFQAISANCALEFLVYSGYTYVAFGGDGLAIYRYQQGQLPQRVGYHWSAELSGITDMAFGPFGSLACVSGDNVYLLSFSPSNQNLVLHGKAVSQNASLNAARVRLLQDLYNPDDSYLIVGTRTGRLRVYKTSISESGGLPPASSLNTPLNVGDPIVDLALFSDSVRALAAWEYPSGKQYIAVGGSDGMVYLYRFASDGLGLIGKAMHHPAPVEEIVVNGDRLIVGLRNGLVYVWNYNTGSVTHHLTIKEPWSPLGAYSLCALPNDRVAVATGSVRVYSLANGAQVGEYGAQVAINTWSLNYYYGWYGMQTDYASVSFVFSTYLPYLRLAPSIRDANNYFYVVSPYTYVRSAFLPAPSGLSVYQVTASQSPAYAVAPTSSTPPYAVGYANGVVNAFGGTQNVGEPVFALASAGVGNWLLGSYGTGKVFAWNGGTFVANILPASSSPRIIYDLRVVRFYSPYLHFTTVSGDGKVEMWLWNVNTPNTPASLASVQQLPDPLHSLSVNAARNQVAVASRNAVFNPNANQYSAWILPLSGNILGAPTGLNHNVRLVAYHPTDYNLLACAVVEYPSYYVHPIKVSLLRSGDTQLHGLGYSYASGYITSLDWTQDGRVLASDSGGMVYLFSPTGARNNRKNRDGTTNNIYYGNPADALQAAYQPHRGFVYTCRSAANTILTAGADGKVIQFSNNGASISTFYTRSRIASIDYLPNDGVVTSHIMAYPASNIRYALFPSDPADVAFWIPYTSTAIYTNPVVQEVSNNELRVGQAFVSYDYPHIGADFYYRVELAEDGSLAVAARLDGWSPTNPGLARVWILSRQAAFPYFSGSRYTLHGYNTTWNYFCSALSPSGDYFAHTINDTTINIYQTRSIPQNNPPQHHSVVQYSSAVNFRALKFLADDVLAVLHFTNNATTLDVWHRNGTTWTLRQTITLQGVSIPSYYYSYYYPLDAVAVGSSVRVVLGGVNALVFYKMTRDASGVPSLTEVGRATAASNGYLDVPSITWVRFSRHNPNILGVVHANRVAITYDLSNLFNW